MNMQNSDNRNLKEKIKNFWINYKKNWIWVNIGAYGSYIIIFWVLFFVGIIDLALVIVLTILPPLLISVAYYARTSKHKKIMSKIVLIGCGGLSLGFFIWIACSYVFIAAPWALLRVLPAALRGRINLLLLISSWGFASYLMYRIGKKREWIFPNSIFAT